MTLTDNYTKWAEAAALKDKTASSVAGVLYSVSFQAVNNVAKNDCHAIGDVPPWLPSDHIIRSGEGVCQSADYMFV